MKNKVITILAASFMLLALCSCGQKASAVFNNLTVTNISSEEIRSIAIQTNGETAVVENAGGKELLKLKEKVLFDMGEKEDLIFYIEITDRNGNVFKSQNFNKDFTLKEDGMVNIVINKDIGNKWTFEEDSQ